ncbi:hypothetical protein Hanom_Chr08g00685761 [Helianthus anomalus]
MCFFFERQRISHVNPSCSGQSNLPLDQVLETDWVLLRVTLMGELAGN